MKRFLLYTLDLKGSPLLLTTAYSHAIAIADYRKRFNVSSAATIRCYECPVNFIID